MPNLFVEWKEAVSHTPSVQAVNRWRKTNVRLRAAAGFLPPFQEEEKPAHLWCHAARTTLRCDEFDRVQEAATVITLISTCVFISTLWASSGHVSIRKKSHISCAVGLSELAFRNESIPGTRAHPEDTRETDSENANGKKQTNDTTIDPLACESMPTCNCSRRSPGRSPSVRG